MIHRKVCEKREIGQDDSKTGAGLGSAVLRTISLDRGNRSINEPAQRKPPCPDDGGQGGFDCRNGQRENDYAYALTETESVKASDCTPYLLSLIHI